MKMETMHPPHGHNILARTGLFHFKRVISLLKSSFLLRLSIFIVLFLYSGCDYSRQYSQHDFNFLRTGAVAVLPFNNLSPYPYAGEIVTELLYTELYATEKLVLIPPHEVKKRLGIEVEEGIDGLTRRYTIAQIAEKLDADSLVIGSVSEFKYKKGVHDKPVVGMDVKLVVAPAGDTVWATSYTREDFSFLFHIGSLNETAQKACRYVARSLTRSLDKRR
jgi:TolB-like protein